MIELPRELRTENYTTTEAWIDALAAAGKAQADAFLRSIGLDPDKPMPWQGAGGNIPENVG